MEYDFCGWATKNNIKCTDGRIIMRDAFKHQDQADVPIVWQHMHDSPYNVLGKAILENRPEGVYAYGFFNDTEQGQNAKLLVQHGDVDSLSICAGKLTQKNGMVYHGTIRELSLVLTGANPGAKIEDVVYHSDGYDPEDLIAYTDNSIEHSDDITVDNEGENDMPTEVKEKTIDEIIESMTDEQQDAMNAVIATVVKNIINDDNDDEKDEVEVKDEMEHSYNGGYEESMSYNIFEENEVEEVLTHSDEMAILDLAKQSNVGSFRTAMELYAEDNDRLEHAFSDEAIEKLFPEYKTQPVGAPPLVERDMTWVDFVMSKISKSPISRIRTRQADARVADLRAKGYKTKGNEKKITGKIKLINRTTDPQTVYIKDTMHRDDIVDITDFDVVAYQWNVMRRTLNEELALAALIGDGREEADADKINETHIRSIWNDDEQYTIHADIDINSARTELQGTNTGANFGENYIYAEAIIAQALYSREKFKGSGTPDLYCTPHMLNVMLLARDLNGRRIYSSKTDLAAALNVNSIITVEQFDGKVREDKDGKKHKLLGIFVNLSDYQFGATKGGEVTKFEDFDIDFNRYKYMLETRLSGALTLVQSAIALEENVAEG